MQQLRLQLLLSTHACTHGPARQPERHCAPTHAQPAADGHTHCPPHPTTIPQRLLGASNLCGADSGQPWYPIHSSIHHCGVVRTTPHQANPSTTCGLYRRHNLPLIPRHLTSNHLQVKSAQLTARRPLPRPWGMAGGVSASATATRGAQAACGVSDSRRGLHGPVRRVTSQSKEVAVATSPAMPQTVHCIIVRPGQAR